MCSQQRSAVAVSRRWQSRVECQRLAVEGVLVVLWALVWQRLACGQRPSAGQQGGQWFFSLYSGGLRR